MSDRRRWYWQGRDVTLLVITGEAMVGHLIGGAATWWIGTRVSWWLAPPTYFVVMLLSLWLVTKLTEWVWPPRVSSYE